MGQYYVQLAAVKSARLVYEEQLNVLKGMRAHFGHQLSRVSSVRATGTVNMNNSSADVSTNLNRSYVQKDKENLTLESGNISPKLPGAKQTRELSLKDALDKYGDPEEVQVVGVNNDSEEVVEKQPLSESSKSKRQKRKRTLGDETTVTANK